MSNSRKGKGPTKGSSGRSYRGDAGITITPKKILSITKRAYIKSQLPEYVNICTYNTRTTLLGPNIENLIEELHPSKPALTKKEFNANQEIEEKRSARRDSSRSRGSRDMSSSGSGSKNLNRRVQSTGPPRAASPLEPRLLNRMSPKMKVEAMCYMGRGDEVNQIDTQGGAPTDGE